MFYELKHSMAVDYLVVERGQNFSFPPHIHHCFEIITVTQGQMQVTVGEESYLLAPGKAVMVFPNRIHAMTSIGESKHIVCVFSPRLVSSFAKAQAGRIPECAIFDLPTPHATLLYELRQEDSISRIKGVLYLLCALFDEGASYRLASFGEETLLHGIFAFIEEHYGEECSLEALSKHLSYSYGYLSRYFKQTVGLSYNDYVNHYRVGEVCNRLDESDDSILKISEECGFTSLRSMNRNFKSRTGMTPAEYRHRKK